MQSQPFQYTPPWAPDPALLEKQQARRVGNSVGGAMLIVEGVMVALSLVISIALGILPDGAELYNQPIFQWVYQIGASTVMFTLPFLLVPVLAKTKLRRVFAAGPVRLGVFFSLVCLAMGVAALGNYGSGLLEQMTEGLGIQGADISDLGTPEGPLGFLLMLVGASVVPALVEEFAMRGIVLGVVRERLGDTLGIFVSAFLFALMHRNVAALPFTFVGGLVFAYITVYAGSVWPAVVAHFLNNFLATLTTEAEKYLAPSMVDLLYLAYTLLFITVGLVGFILFTRKNKTAFAVQGYAGQANQKKVAKWVLSSPCMVIYMLFFVIESVLLAWVM